MDTIKPLPDQQRTKAPRPNRRRLAARFLGMLIFGAGATLLVTQAVPAQATMPSQHAAISQAAR